MSLVTIILPAYNAEKTIARAIQSARCQEYSDLEIIVIDDGSSDSTLNICNALADKDNDFTVGIQYAGRHRSSGMRIQGPIQ